MSSSSGAVAGAGVGAAVVVRRWTQALLDAVWSTEDFQQIVNPSSLPSPGNEKAQKTLLLKDRCQSMLSWSAKDMPFLAGMVIVFRTMRHVATERDAWAKILMDFDEKLSEEKARAFFVVNTDPGAVAHVRQLLDAERASDAYRALITACDCHAGPRSRVVLSHTHKTTNRKRKFGAGGRANSRSRSAKYWVD